MYAAIFVGQVGKQYSQIGDFFSDSRKTVITNSKPNLRL